ncbi:hypothetical protein GQR58_009811 [Nymphon striatum]|nr:hypothetical protein GQR58_009811 [Nymphon striatum]
MLSRSVQRGLMPATKYIRELLVKVLSAQLNLSEDKDKALGTFPLFNPTAATMSICPYAADRRKYRRFRGRSYVGRRPRPKPRGSPRKNFNNEEGSEEQSGEGNNEGPDGKPMRRRRRFVRRPWVSLPRKEV